MQYDFNLKARIQGKDGECGQLTGLVIYPEARLVSDLIVKRGYLMAQQHVVPIATVQSALEDDVYLSIDSYELNQYPEYRVVEFEEPVTGPEQRTMEMAGPYGLQGALEPIVPTRKRKIYEGIAPNQRVIESGMAIENLDGRIGKVVRVVVDRQHNEISYMVAQRGLIFHEQLVVPITMVETVSEDSIMVIGGDQMLEELPRYNEVVHHKLG